MRSDVDLTLAGLDESAVRIWLERDADGEIIGSTGFELSDDREHALIRTRPGVCDGSDAGVALLSPVRSVLAAAGLRECGQVRTRGGSARNASGAPLRREWTARTGGRVDAAARR
jgi:hypothetical protein